MNPSVFESRARRGVKEEATMAQSIIHARREDRRMVLYRSIMTSTRGVDSTCKKDEIAQSNFLQVRARVHRRPPEISRKPTGRVHHHPPPSRPQKMGKILPALPPSVPWLLASFRPTPIPALLQRVLKPSIQAYVQLLRSTNMHGTYFGNIARRNHETR